ncbi:TPA: IS91 family transposase [Vibrio harveyi]
MVQYTSRRRRHTPKEFIPRATKLLFEKDNAWEKVLWKHAQTFSLWQITCVERMLACGSNMMGAKHYDCGTPNCPHTKVICQSCKTKACSSCGTKSTEQWISTQLDVMPDCEHQHITFTMPSELWPIFEANPTLLNDLFSLAADTLLKWAKKHGLEVGIFGALHTYGRGLNWHPHIHLSVTRGGLDKHNIWRPIYFKKKHVEYHWRRCLIGLLRRKYGELNLLTSSTNHIQDSRQWHFFLERQYQRYWNIHFAQKTQELKQTVNYLGRYLKRPPISASRLRHYSGGTVVFKYLDHRDGKYKTKTLTQEEMILRYVSHIPQHHFKMVRYYGFLSNRKRGRLLPLVYLALGEKAPKQPELLTYAKQYKGFTGNDPYQCVLCGSRMVFTGFTAGSKNRELLDNRRMSMRESRRLGVPA